MEACLDRYERELALEEQQAQERTANAERSAELLEQHRREQGLS